MLLQFCLLSQVCCLWNYGSYHHSLTIWTWLWRRWCETFQSNTGGGFIRAGSSAWTETRGSWALNGVWLLGTFSTVGLENNVLTLLCSAQSCHTYYTFNSPDRISLGSYDSEGRASGLQPPNRANASFLVLLLSDEVPWGKTFPSLWKCTSQCMSRQSCRSAWS